MSNDTRVLDLSAIFDRPTVKLGASTYELRNRDEFSLLELDHLQRLLGRAEAMQESADDPEALAKASALLADLADLLVINLDQPVPDLAVLQISDFWASHFKQETPVPPRRSRRTTAASSPGSKRSTAATRKPGSTSRNGS